MTTRDFDLLCRETEDAADSEPEIVTTSSVTLTTYPSGATRSSDADDVRYDLVSTVGLRRLAARYALGVKTHGERNWEQGVPASAVVKHLLRHFFLWWSGDRSDDHLAAAAWGLFALMHYEEKQPTMLNQ